MKTPKKNTGLFRYLEKKGLIGSANKEAIAQARLEYTKIYNREYLRKKYAREKRITLYLTSEDFDRIEHLKSKWGIPSNPQLIRDIVRAYMQERSIVIQPHILIEIRAKYYEIREVLASLHDKKNFSIFFKSEFEEALKSLDTFQNEVIEILENPHTKTD